MFEKYQIAQLKILLVAKNVVHVLFKIENVKIENVCLKKVPPSLSSLPLSLDFDYIITVGK